jgi:hypothetical protein
LGLDGVEAWQQHRAGVYELLPLLLMLLVLPSLP